MIKKLTFELQTGKFYIVRVLPSSRDKDTCIKEPYFSYFIGKKHIWHTKDYENYYIKTVWESTEKLCDWLIYKIKDLEIYEADTKEETLNFIKNFRLAEKFKA